LTLCFVDPYSIGIHFSTIFSLSQCRKIDFCVCWHQEWMQAAIHITIRKKNAKKSTILLGSETWREDWEKSKEGLAHEPNLGDFICREFSRKMEAWGTCQQSYMK